MIVNRAPTTSLTILLTLALAAGMSARARVAAAPPDAPATTGDVHARAVEGEPQAHADRAPPNPLAIGPDLAIVTAIIFLLLLLFLTKFAWRPIVEALDRRERSIAENIAAAAARREEAEQLLQQYEANLSGAADEVRNMLEEARRDAEVTKAEIVADAKAAAQTEQQRAVREVQDAADAAMRQLAEHSADLAIDLAGKIVQQELKAEDHARLIRDTVAQMPSEK
jgi:F-type H+-transporting ATPase subunit b